MMSGLIGLEALIVELHGGEGLGRQVGHHHVGGRDQPADDLLAGLGHRVEGHAALVAVHLLEERAVAGLRDRGLEAVLAARALLDPDHLGAEIGEQGGAIGPGDIAAEIQHPDARQDIGHRRVSFVAAFTA